MPGQGVKALELNSAYYTILRRGCQFFANLGFRSGRLSRATTYSGLQANRFHILWSVRIKLACSLYHGFMVELDPQLVVASDRMATKRRARATSLPRWASSRLTPPPSPPALRRSNCWAYHRLSSVLEDTRISPLSTHDMETSSGSVGRGGRTLT